MTNFGTALPNIINSDIPPSFAKAIRTSLLIFTNAQNCHRHWIKSQVDYLWTNKHMIAEALYNL